MSRQFFLDLAKNGEAYPIGTDLVLHEKPDPKAVVLDGRQLGQVVVESARRYRTPLAVPLMDLQIEKAAVLTVLGVPEAKRDSYHFDAAPTEETIQKIERALADKLPPRMQSACDSLRYVAGQGDLLPIGLCIGPFSFMSKFLADPITPVYLAGAGTTAQEDPEVALLEAALELGVRVLSLYAAAQIKAGAKALVICEPAANTTYLSPMQIEAGADIFERFVMKNLRRLTAVFERHGADMILHDCGELTAGMLRDLASLEPAVFSLGSSRQLWEDARIVPQNVVLYGNLPSKQFYSDTLMSQARVAEQTRDLLKKMQATGHPYMLGTECDVLSVVGHEQTLREKVAVMLEAAGKPGGGLR